MDDTYIPATFLFVDDDEVSIMALRRAMEQLKLINPVQVARDGVEALGILRDATRPTNTLPPYIITLDLSMPRMNGLEFLEEIRTDSILHSAVIFVLTTSDSPADIASAYSKNIAGYVVKEDAVNSFAKALNMVDQYARLVVLPGNREFNKRDEVSAGHSQASR